MVACAFVLLFTWPPQEVCIPNTVTRRMTGAYGLGNTHTQTWAHGYSLHKCLALGVQGDLGTIQRCIHKAAAVFILLCLSRSFKTNPLGPGATGFVCPECRHTDGLASFQTHTLITVLMIQTQQGFQAVWTGWLLGVDEAGQRGKINGEELPEEETGSWKEKHHKTDWLI